MADAALLLLLLSTKREQRRGRSGCGHSSERDGAAGNQKGHQENNRSAQEPTEHRIFLRQILCISNVAEREREANKS
jgi:hypothetical protein